MDWVAGGGHSFYFTQFYGSGKDRQCYKLASEILKSKMATENEEGGIIRRNRPGTKSSDMYNWPEQDYTEMDSILDGKEIHWS